MCRYCRHSASVHHRVRRLGASEISSLRIEHEDLTATSTADRQISTVRAVAAAVGYGPASRLSSHRPGLYIPNLGCLVFARGRDFSFGGVHGYVVNLSKVSLESLPNLERLCVPNDRSAVDAGGGEPSTVGAEVDRSDFGLVTPRVPTESVRPNR